MVCYFGVLGVLYDFFLNLFIDCSCLLTAIGINDVHFVTENVLVFNKFKGSSQMLTLACSFIMCFFSQVLSCPQCCDLDAILQKVSFLLFLLCGLSTLFFHLPLRSDQSLYFLLPPGLSWNGGVLFSFSIVPKHSTSQLQFSSPIISNFFKVVPPSVSKMLQRSLLTSHHRNYIMISSLPLKCPEFD